MKEHKPIYPYSFEEAERNGEMDLYKQSHNENIACAKAIEIQKYRQGGKVTND